MHVRHDYACPEVGCTEEAFDCWTTERPSCKLHNLPMEIAYHPKSYRPFESFDFEGNDGRTTRVSSLHQLREIEASSIAAYERGDPKARPFLFRGFTQDQSNRDVNLFQRLHPQVRREDLRTRSRSGVPFVTSRSGPVIEED